MIVMLFVVWVVRVVLRFWLYLWTLVRYCVQEDEDTDKPKIEDLDEDEEDEDKEKSKDKKKKKKIKEKYTEVCVLYW